MWTLVLARLRRHLARSVMTGLAVVVGVAFMAGTMILTDTMGRSFDELFATGNEGIDVVVQRPTALESDAGAVAERLDVDLLPAIRAVDGVGAAAGTVEGLAQLSHLDGTPLPGQTVTIGVAWLDDDRLNPFALASGRAPTSDDEVVLDQATAEREGWELGDQVLVAAAQAPEEMTVVGVATYGEVEGVPGVAAVAVEEATAQALFAQPGRYDTIVVAADDATSATELTERVRAAVGGDQVEVTSGATDTAEQQDDFEEDIAFFGQMLLAFAAVALFVGMFIISNTFAITMAQRSQEMALLRAIGAGRRQVLRAVLAESAGIGLLASALGLGLGIVVARALDGFLAAIGIAIPDGETVITGGTVVTSFVVGTTVTLLSAVLPAVRASRTAPLAALRASTVEASHPSRVRTGVGGVLLAVGGALVASGIASGGDGALTSVGAGSAVTFLAVVALGPALSRRVVDVLGIPLTRLSRITGRLARENARRNARRTATTASALMVGVTLVGFITILAGSSKASITEAIDRSLRADFTISSGAPAGAEGGFSPAIEERLAALPEVAVATPLRSAPVGVDGGTSTVVAVDPSTIDRVMDLEVRTGSLAALADGGVAVRGSWADDHGLAVGDVVTLRFARTGPVSLPVAAVIDGKVLGAGESRYVVDLDTFEANVTDQLDRSVFVALRSGTSAGAGAAALEAALADWPAAEIQDQAAFKEAVTTEIDTMLNLTYGLLALAVVIALIGIANTLALAVHERTRELGLMRAVGMSRRQVRASIRQEAILISLLGVVVGSVLAVGLAAAVVAALDDTGTATFAVPVRSLATIAVLATLAGVAAAAGPARRAARLDILAAIAAP
ncbi:MAG TPA: FtsX-like permease family protein [Iamia sp.]|nr:FtsX-like permease family protein [Iamia sp.]